MEILYVSVKDIKPYKLNAKKHPKKQVQYIANSISEFGFKQPIVLDKNNEIIIGHGRFEAAKSLGYTEVPCLYADDLTEDQVKALRLADNKVAESDWDFGLLDVELNDILDIDMTDFGFTFVDHEEEQRKTQEKVESILNLNKGSFPGVPPYDIPELDPVKSLPPIKEWIGFNYMLSDPDPTGKAVHFFIDDYQFERVWNNPEKYVEKLSQYVCVATPDFSPYSDMPFACQLFNHYRKHWVGRYLQDRGVTVIPTIRASRDERSLDWYLDGEPHGGIVIISAMWTGDKDGEAYFRKEYGKMYETLDPCKVFLYGHEVEGLPGTIEHVNTFTQGRWGK